MTNTKSGGQLLTQLREQRRWSKADLARASGVSTTTVANYERGARLDGTPFKPHASKVYKLAGAFGSADGTQLLEAYGFRQEAEELKRGPSADTATTSASSHLEAGAILEVVGPLGAIGERYVLKDEEGRLTIAEFKDV